MIPLVIVEIAAAKVGRRELGSEPDGLIAIVQSLLEFSLFDGKRYRDW